MYEKLCASMSQNILNKNTRSITARLYNANYFDFMLYKGETIKQSAIDISGMTIADFTDWAIIDGKLYSTATWSGATNNGVLLEDIGLVGIDNGFIQYQKDRITNEEFLKMLLESTYEIESGDTRLFLSPITGNTQDYEYPMSVVNSEEGKYIAFKGGFYQGFFKLEGYDYQVLPNKMEDDLLFHFDIRPRDYEVGDYTINHIHPENEGIFFYIGTRAENKFWPFYKANEDIVLSLKKKDAQSEGYFDGCGEESGETYNVRENGVVNADWVNTEPEPEPESEPMYFVDDYFDKEHTEKGCVPSMDVIVRNHDNSYFADDYFDYGDDKTVIFAKKDLKFDISHIDNHKMTVSTKEEPKCTCECGKNYFRDEYFNDQCVDTDKFAEEDYIKQDIKIDTSGESYTDSMGHVYSKGGYYEISTDNKFITFNNTPYGYTVDTWSEDIDKVVYTQRQAWPNANYFILMNQTPTGYTVDNIEQYNETHRKDYNIHKDIRNNAFCLRVTDKGAIGYKYAIFTCDEDSIDHYKLEEEYSKDGIVTKDNWNSINVRFVLIDSPKDKKRKLGKMKVMIYVNGFLVFISKELDAFNFKELDEIYQKQEGVPYNISIGGGSQGLLEAIVPDYYAISDYILPIERDFCGSFMGDIKSFKIYSGFLDYSSISDYLS